MAEKRSLMLLDKASNCKRTKISTECTHSVVFVRQRIQNVYVEHVPESPREASGNHAGADEYAHSERQFDLKRWNKIRQASVRHESPGGQYCKQGAHIATHHFSGSSEQNNDDQRHERCARRKTLVVPLVLIGLRVQRDLHLNLVRARVVDDGGARRQRRREGARIAEVDLALRLEGPVDERLPEERVGGVEVVGLLLPGQVRDDVEGPSILLQSERE